MEIPEHRRWMYNRLNPKTRDLLSSFLWGVENFINAACELNDYKVEGKFRCPCLRCQCVKFQTPDDVRRHLYAKGFQRDYYYWHNHGETTPSIFARTIDVDHDGLTNFEQMVMDVGGPSFEPESEEPNDTYKRFNDLLCAAQAPLWDGCDDHSVLSIAARIMSIKTDYNLPVKCVDEIIQLIKEVLPSGNRMLPDFYQTKKLVSQLGCGHTKIDTCPSGCMLYRGSDSAELSCKFCGETRFKENSTTNNRIPKKQMWYLPIIPRLQRLYASKATAKHMTWHYENRRERGVLSHPSDAKGWKHFDEQHPSFALEPRNVRLGLCSDGFSPFNHEGRVYSCWPVIITPYNLPPTMCLKREYLFLTIIIPGPSNPKSKIDVYLQPLIDDLKLLWSEGVETYDVYKKQNFNLRAALIWTINDFPAYGMLSGWSTSGKLGCPVCMDDSKSFYLKNGRKVCHFDCHRQFLPMNHPFRRNRQDFLKGRVEKDVPPKRRSGHEVLQILMHVPRIVDTGINYHDSDYGESHHWTKRSIFWDLPYWKDLLNPHNIDVMHTETNIFQNVFNTVMDVKGKSKDNLKSRMDISMHCSRPTLELQDMGNGKVLKPKAQYTLDMDKKRKICEWVQGLKLPDGYVSNLASCVDLRACTLHHMKSHDCHVFMERLLPIAFNCLPKPIWETLTELSIFFRDLCCPTLDESRLRVMENNIPIILCKLEKIFPPSFFDVMEHLPIHLVYEAEVGGPVQYRWMYPFERFLGTLKKKVKNKARVEGSICEAYLLEETSIFCSHYFETYVHTRNRRVPRNDDGGESSEHPPLSIFNYPSRLAGVCKTRFLSHEEKFQISLYVLSNCPEVNTFYNEYISSVGVGSVNFVEWFQDYVGNPLNGVDDPLIRSLAWGLINQVETYTKCFVNGYCFHISELAQTRKTNNSGVALFGEHRDYHGVLQEIIVVEYPGLPTKRVTIFNCKWFDPTSSGTRICPKYGFVEVKSNRRLRSKDTFILAQQAEQVYYTPWPNPNNDRKGWFSVIKTKSRRLVQSLDAPFQDEANYMINELSHLEEFDVALLDNSQFGEEFNNANLIEDEEICDSDDCEFDNDTPIDDYMETSD